MTPVRHGSRRRVCVTFVMWAILLASLPAHAADRLGEYRVKAACLYNLAKFVQCPPSAGRSSPASGSIRNCSASPDGERARVPRGSDAHVVRPCGSARWALAPSWNGARKAAGLEAFHAITLVS